MAQAMGIYVEDGQLISTHSMMKSFRRCPKQAEYKYVERLKPRILGAPLRRGTWMHRLIEAKHTPGEDWKEVHQRLIDEVWSKLFDEERDEIGNLPDECYRMMLSYLWHYRDDNWKVLETEFLVETEFPDGSIYRGKVDNLIEDQFGLWIVDHKNLKTFPDMTQRVQDAQSALYIWAARRMGIPVEGHIWNYLSAKVPTVPTFTAKTGAVSRWDSMATDYPTAARFFKEEFDGKVPKQYQAKMRYLKGQRYIFGTPNSSVFFQRSTLEKNDRLVDRIVNEAFHTHRRMHTYPFDKTDFVERVPDRSCKWMCSYNMICTGELFTGSVNVALRKRGFKQADPLEYYYDELEDKDKDN